MKKVLGKLEKVVFGLGGYQDAMLGIHVVIRLENCGVHDSKCAWDYKTIEWTENCKWTEESRFEQYAGIMRYVSGLLSDAKVTSVDKLLGTPVEAVLEGSSLKSWRVLTEVV